ncbi:MAG: elongation factor 1-beta [Candidatus Bathyarchaeia archaeon]
MGLIVSSFKVFPSGPEIDLNLLREGIKRAMPEGVTVQRFGEEPIAFGLVALHVDIVMPEDSAGMMEKIEEILRSIDGVSQIDTLMVRRLSVFR